MLAYEHDKLLETAAERDQLREVNAVLVKQLKLALQYLEHPDVQAIPFVFSAAGAARRAHAAIEKARKEG